MSDALREPPYAGKGKQREDTDRLRSVAPEKSAGCAQPSSYGNKSNPDYIEDVCIRFYASQIMEY